ncbi:hypothetical protein [Clostridium sp.]|uniref:hypothetical protein n=1 Tax=Clostridium sp. TaxID=1506 RepID=UPI00262FDA86|nr:hypothetical protein [Clostridium sp.]
MLGVLISILQLILVVVLVFGGFSLLSRYVFNRVRVNKWIILAAAIIIFLIPMFVPMNTWIMLIVSAISVMLLFWFFDVQRNGYPKVKKDKKIVIKPKAKPNRVKHNNTKK